MSLRSEVRLFAQEACAQRLTGTFAGQVALLAIALTGAAIAYVRRDRFDLLQVSW